MSEPFLAASRSWRTGLSGHRHARSQRASSGSEASTGARSTPTRHATGGGSSGGTCGPTSSQAILSGRGVTPAVRCP